MATKRDKLVETLFENMSTVKRTMSGHMQALNRDCPISHAQLELLFAIRHTQPVSFKQLAKQLYLTPGAVSQVADSLEQQELIVRKADADDRRVQCLTVSAKGATLLADIEKRRHRIIDIIIQDLSDEELEAWLRVQQKIISHFHTDINNTNQKEKA